MKNLRGKVAVVTGAASGIGLALAERFASEGMKVVMADIEAGPLADRGGRRCGGPLPRSSPPRVDVSSPDDVERLARETYEAFGAAHVLCNNAGVAVIGAVHEHTLADWQWVVNVNLWGVIHGVRAFLPRMLAGGDEGHIVNTASMAGLTTAPFMSVYDVTKHGVVALSEAMYKEAQVTGSPIGVSVVCPGLIDTNIMRSSRNRPEALAEQGKAGPMAQAFGQGLSDRLAGGYPPSEVAEQVVDGIRDGPLLHRAGAARGEGRHRDPGAGPPRAAEPDAAPRVASGRADSSGEVLQDLGTATEHFGRGPDRAVRSIRFARVRPEASAVQRNAARNSTGTMMVARSPVHETSPRRGAHRLDQKLQIQGLGS